MLVKEIKKDIFTLKHEHIETDLGIEDDFCLSVELKEGIVNFPFVGPIKMIDFSGQILPKTGSNFTEREYAEMFNKTLDQVMRYLINRVKIKKKK